MNLLEEKKVGNVSITKSISVANALMEKSESINKVEFEKAACKRCMFICFILTCLGLISLFTRPAKCNDDILELSQQYKWKMASFFPAGHTDNQLLRDIIAELKRRTKNAVDITLYEGTLGAQSDHWEMVKKNVIQLAFIADAYNLGKLPVSSLSSLMLELNDYPSAIKSLDAWSKAGYLTELTDTFKVLCYKPTPLQYMFLKDKKITTLEEFKGEKIRSVTGIQGEALAALGASPISTSGGEVYMALSTGVIKGTITGPDNIISRKLYEVCKYGMTVPLYSGVWAVAIDKKIWESLPKELQNLMEDVADKAVRADTEKHMKSEENDWKILKEKGIELYSISSEELIKWREKTSAISAKYVEDWAAKGYPTKEAYAVMQKINQKE